MCFNSNVCFLHLSQMGGLFVCMAGDLGNVMFFDYLCLCFLGYNLGTRGGGREVGVQIKNNRPYLYNDSCRIAYL